MFQSLKKKPDVSAKDDDIVSDLTKLFHVGQYVRCMIVGLPGDPAPGASKATTSMPAQAVVLNKSIQLSLRLKKLCSALGTASLYEGAVVPASVRSAEDHGYTLDLGIKVLLVYLTDTMNV